MIPPCCKSMCFAMGWHGARKKSQPSHFVEKKRIDNWAKPFDPAFDPIQNCVQLCFFTNIWIPFYFCFQVYFDTQMTGGRSLRQVCAHMCVCLYFHSCQSVFVFPYRFVFPCGFVFVANLYLYLYVDFCPGVISNDRWTS